MRPEVTDAEGVAVMVWNFEAEGVGVVVTGAGEAVAVTGDGAQDQPALVNAAGSEHTKFWFDCAV